MRIDRRKKGVRFELRFNEDDLGLIAYCAYKCNMDISTYIRTVVLRFVEPARKNYKESKLTYEDIKTLCDNKLQFKNLFNGKVK